jgi:hypothetical protein
LLQEHIFMPKEADLLTLEGVLLPQFFNDGGLFTHSLL